MRKLLLTYLLFSLSGCATMLDYQKECEKQNPNFQDMTVCLKEKVEADPRSSASASQAYVQRYLLEADRLAEQVKKKKLTETEARIRLSDLYIQLKSITDSNQRAAVSQWQNQQLINNLSAPKTTNCFGGYGSVSCSTY